VCSNYGLFTNLQIHIFLNILFFLFFFYFIYVRKKRLIYIGRDEENEYFQNYRCRYERVNYLRRTIICFLSTWKSLMPLDRSEHCPLRTPTVTFVCSAGCRAPRGAMAYRVLGQPRLCFNVMTIN